MAVIPLPLDTGKVRYMALTADALPTDVADPGDRAIITDGPDKLFNGTSWVDDTTDLGETTQPISVADGADVTQGALADAVVAAGASGSISAKLRRLTTDIGAVLTALAALVQKSDTVAAAATLANIASSASNVTLQALNASRKGWVVFNDSTAVLYIKFAATASATSYTVQVPAGGYYELPKQNAIYTGIIDGIWASANGNARVTEW